MANLKISGVWKDAKGVITHYGIHTQTENSHTRVTQISKAEAIKQVGDPANTTYTWLWDYQSAYWKTGEKVTVVNDSYLRSNPDNKLTDNLAHLINYDWLS